MTRINQLTENIFPAMVDQLQRDIDELKGAQLIGGDNIVYFQSQTANQYDATSSIANAWQWWNVTATSETMQGFWAVLIPYLYADTPANFYGPEKFWVDTFTTVASPLSIKVIDNPSAAVLPGSKSWLVGINTSSSTARTYYLKFYVLGLDNATITCVAV
jgi:hypothetical protein